MKSFIKPAIIAGCLTLASCAKAHDSNSDVQSIKGGVTGDVEQIVGNKCNNTEAKYTLDELMLIAEEHIKGGKPQEAYECYAMVEKKSEELIKRAALLNNVRGIILFNNFKFDKALELFERATQLDPLDEKYQNDLELYRGIINKNRDVLDEKKEEE